MTTTARRIATAAALRGADRVRGLTVRQPWASAICYLGKRIENRTRMTTYTGLVLIHGGKNVDEAAMRDAPRDLPQLAARGVVLGVARLTGCHNAAICHGKCSEWADVDKRPWHWQLDHVLPLARPIPARGALYLWDPDHQDRQLRQQIATVLMEEVTHPTPRPTT